MDAAGLCNIVVCGAVQRRAPVTVGSGPFPFLTPVPRPPARRGTGPIALARYCQISVIGVALQLFATQGRANAFSIVRSTL